MKLPSGSGDLDRKLTFQARTIATTESKSAREQWADSFTVWGSFEPLGASENPVQLTVDTDVTRISEEKARFAIDYRTGIDPHKNRIVMAEKVGSSTWNIVAPMHFPKEGWTIIEAERVQ
jgi:head-tail adaptor